MQFLLKYTVFKMNTKRSKTARRLGVAALRRESLTQNSVRGAADRFFFFPHTVFTVCTGFKNLKKPSDFKKVKNPSGPIQELQKLVNKARLETSEFVVLKQPACRFSFELDGNCATPQTGNLQALLLPPGKHHGTRNAVARQGSGVHTPRSPPVMLQCCHPSGHEHSNWELRQQQEQEAEER